MSEESRHQTLREMLGAYALGHLPQQDADAVWTHLEDCPACRADLAEIQPVARRLDAVDAALFEDPPTPPPDLGERIRAEIAGEKSSREEDQLGARRAAVDRRRVAVRRSWVAAAAVVVALAGVGALGGWIGRETAPAPAAVPTEPISLRAPGSAGVTVESADLVAHSWGVELRMVAAGFADGEQFRAWFRTESGELAPAGEFRGVGASPMTCYLQSAAMREDVTEVVVTDESGRTVLASSL